MMTVMIEATGNLVDRMIPVRLGWRKKSAIMTLAEITEGRATIANAIETFYFETGSDQWGEPPDTVGVVFKREQPKFIGIGQPSNSPCAKD
ncbi:MAG: hypothetical protein ABIG70_00950 [Pseudomonadota bacterium]